MTDSTEPGFRVTLKDVYNKLEQIEDAIDSRLRKVEIQVGAQWVVIALIVVGLGGLVTKAFTG